MTIPSEARFVVVGAGIHGLSTAVHLAELLEEQGDSGAEVVVLEKQHVGAGATGVSGGIVRNFYLSAAMNELVRRSVEIFELDPTLFGFRQVGYVAAVPDEQREGLELIAEQHRTVGYESTLVTDDAALDHLRSLFPDWAAAGVTAVLHERRSGWADAATTLTALAGMARSAGVRVLEGVEVTGFHVHHEVVERVETSAGEIACEAVAIAPGPWARDLWRLLELPEDLGGSSAFHYWEVQEGVYVHSDEALDERAPVVHVDLHEPLRSPEGTALLPGPWGIYFRPGLGGGVTGGGLPHPLDPDCELDPYGPSHPGRGHADPVQESQFTAGLGTALGRFAGGSWRSESFRAPMCFTPDAYPIVGWLRGNVYAVLDSNHGFKLLGLGRLAAAELMGAEVPELEPFRLARFGAATEHPVSASPYPWT